MNVVESCNGRDTVWPVPRLRVGSWPGPRFRDNPMIAELCASLAEAGAVVSDVDDPCRIMPGEIDILQVHWPEQIFWQGAGPLETARKARAVVRSLRSLKARGTTIVWMVHNLTPHDARRWQRLVWAPYRAAIAHLADGFVTLSPSTMAVVRDAVPGLSRKPSRFVWHPGYQDAAAGKDERAQMRKMLGLEPSTRVLACLGHVRPYKGIEALIAAFRDTLGDLALVIGGTPRDAAFARQVTALAGDDSRIHLILRRLSEREFKALTAAADEIVAPFTGYLHSGTIVHALSAGRPVCAPDSPFARDFATSLASGWVRLYQPPLTAAVLAAASISRDLAPILPDGRDAARRMMRFYRALA